MADFLKIVVICVTVLLGLFMVLLALPKSRLRSIVLEMMGWSVTGASAVCLVSPIDLVPDFIPVLGQVDDVGYLLLGIASGVMAYLARKQRHDRLLAAGD